MCIRDRTGFPVSSTAKVMYCRMLDAMLSKDVYKRQIKGRPERILRSMTLKIIPNAYSEFRSTPRSSKMCIRDSRSRPPVLWIA